MTNDPVDTMIHDVEPLQIGPIILAAPVVLAPMAGVTDYAFRTLCREFAPGLLYVNEMVTARALVERNAKTLTMMPPPAEPAPRSAQLYGTAPKTMGEAVRIMIQEYGVAHVDLNFGCPVPKVTRKGGGAALPVRTRLFNDIVTAAVKAASIDSVPLTVKFRIGVDDDIVTFLNAGRIAEEVGAAAVALHARTAEQRYSGHARWEAIAELKQAVTTIPVLGNGDIWVAQDAIDMMGQTGCDGVVIGRGCLGRPWLFRDLLAALTTGVASSHSPSLAEVVPVIRRHAQLLANHDGESNGLKSMRRHCQWYLQGFPVGGEIRKQLGLVENLQQLDNLLDELDLDARQQPGAEAIPRGHTSGPHPVALPDRWLELVDDPTPPVGAEVLVSGG